MKKLFRIMYRYKGDTLLRDFYVNAKSREEAMKEARKLFGKIKITDCYFYH